MDGVSQASNRDPKRKLARFEVALRVPSCPFRKSLGSFRRLGESRAGGCRTKTVENIRQRIIDFGFEQTLNGKKREEPPRPKCLTGDEEARIIAKRLGKPPEGYANWTLRLLARKVVELNITPGVSHETIRKTLKKTG